MTDQGVTWTEVGEEEVGRGPARARLRVQAAIDGKSLEPFVHLSMYEEKPDGEMDDDNFLGVMVMDTDESTHMGLVLLRTTAGAIMTAMALEFGRRLGEIGDRAAEQTMESFLGFIQDGSMPPAKGEAHVVGDDAGESGVGADQLHAEISEEDAAPA